MLREAANQRVLAIATIKELPGTGTGAQLVIAVFAIKLLEDTITGIKAIRATPTVEFLGNAGGAGQGIITILAARLLNVIPIEHLISTSTGQQAIGPSLAIEPRGELPIHRAANNDVSTISASQPQAGAITINAPEAVIANATQKQLVIAGTRYQRIRAAID